MFMIDCKVFYLIPKKGESGLRSKQNICEYKLNRKGQASNLAFYRYVSNAGTKQHKSTIWIVIILAFDTYRINNNLRRYE